MAPPALRSPLLWMGATARLAAPQPSPRTCAELLRRDAVRLSGSCRRRATVALRLAAVGGFHLILPLKKRSHCLEGETAVLVGVERLEDALMRGLKLV